MRKQRCHSYYKVAMILLRTVTHLMIGETGMVDNFDVSLNSSFIRKKRRKEKEGLFFLMKLELSETSKLSTIPVSPIMSLFNQFSTRSVTHLHGEDIAGWFHSHKVSVFIEHLVRHWTVVLAWTKKQTHTHIFLASWIPVSLVSYVVLAIRLALAFIATHEHVHTHVHVAYRALQQHSQNFATPETMFPTTYHHCFCEM